MDLLHEILQPGRKTAIVDVGAAALDGPRPYELLLEHGLCTVVGFDPQAELWPQSRPGVPRFGLETYLPHIIGDGSARTLRVCASPGMTSLYEPDEAVFDLFPGMREWCKIVREEKVATRRLDDLDAVREIDVLKIDAQGSELAVIRGAREKLSRCVCLQVEVQFIRLYKHQPMFRDVDLALADLGFVLHTFCDVNRRMILPFRYEPDPLYAAMRQIFSGDAVYVRDFAKLGKLPDESIKQLAIIAHYCFGSFDLTYRCLDELVVRGRVDAAHLTRYEKSLGDAA